MKIRCLMVTSADLDHRGHAAPVSTQTTVGPEGREVAGGTVRAEGYPVRREPGLEQPTAIGTLQIYMVLVCAGDRVDECFGSASQTGPQAGRNISMGLKAAQGDARTNGSHQIAWAAAKVLNHRFCSLGSDTQGGTPPAGVDCRSYPLSGIAQQNRDAVGGKDAQAQSGGMGNQTVGLHSSGRIWGK